MDKIFITSSIFTAFIDKADAKHPQASAYFRCFANNQFRIYTDYITIDEAYKKISEDITWSLAKNFVKSITLGNINLLSPEPGDIRRAVKVLNSSRAADFTFHQALILVLCEKRGINYICTLNSFQTLFGIKIFTLPV